MMCLTQQLSRKPSTLGNGQHTSLKLPLVKFYQKFYSVCFVTTFNHYKLNWTNFVVWFFLLIIKQNGKPFLPHIVSNLRVRLLHPRAHVSIKSSLEIKSVIVKRGVVTGTIHSSSSQYVCESVDSCHVLPMTVAWMYNRTVTVV